MENVWQNWQQAWHVTKVHNYHLLFFIIVLIQRELDTGTLFSEDLGFYLSELKV